MGSRLFRVPPLCCARTWLLFPLVLPVALSSVTASAEDAARRQIEEVVVTAERKESTVSDTSISISAFTGEFLEDFGIRNQEDLQNLVPAAVIEPYDMAIRGVGRNFRALGGDPGIATYLNGVYSEDFGIASTEGGLFDIERIEFLRGPQGTLYGRNAIGGAVNFINKKPSDEFEGEARVLYGDYDLQEYYGVVSGPIIEGLLQARLTGTKRTRDGYYEDLSGNEDPGNYGDENYALYLRLTPTDNIEINTRVNERSYRRLMGGADAAGIVNFSENGGNVDFGNTRDNTTYAWGYRAVNPAVQCADAFTRTGPVASPGVIGGIGCMVPGRPTFNFTNPVTGQAVTAQRVVAGVDKATTGTTDHPNRAYGTDLSRQRMLGLDEIDGDDLQTDTNGQQDEFFDHQADSTDITWQVNDQFSVKYIFGYTDYFYDRESDTDLTSNSILDNTFYVSQETEYVSHEVQFFFDPNEKLSITTGLFAYDAKITQRGDFYDYNCRGLDPAACPSRYAQDFPYAALGAGGFAALPKMDLYTARNVGKRADDGNPMPGFCLPGAAIGAGDQLHTYCFGSWQGDTGDRIAHGPSTIGTDLEYATRTERNAYAAYTQGVYTFNEHWALTLGVRWAKDQLDGDENAFYYVEEDIIPLGFGAAGDQGVGSPDGSGCAPGTTCTSSLAAVNQALGFQAADGTILNPSRMLLAGMPASISLWRELERDDDDVTWRVNIDWTPSDDTLIYLSSTKGYRAGGFNLNTFASNATYEPEELIAYELGYKGTMLDGQLQVNTAIYYYDYENVHTYAQGAAFSGGYSTGVFAVPTAEMMGWDGDAVWIVTDNIMLGANASYSHSEYTEDFTVIDPNDPTRPGSLFNANSTPINLEGNQMIRVPEMKGGAYGQYTWPLGANGRVEFLANWSWISRVYFSVFESKDQSAPSYSRFDLRASWASEDETWMVAAFCNNVLDEIGIRQVDHYSSTEEINFRRAGATTDPRLFGVELRYKFGGM